MLQMDVLSKNLFGMITDISTLPKGAYNLRANGQMLGRNSTEHVSITSKVDGSGIDITVKPNTLGETIHIPVIISSSGYKETVYNDFYIGENSNVVIIAGCGVHNCGSLDAEHDGIHRFHIGRGAKVHYIEKHYGSGEGKGKRILNPQTDVHLQAGSYMEMEMMQIKGVDSTKRITLADLANDAKLLVRERLMTHGSQSAVSIYKVTLNGPETKADLLSRSVAKDTSFQKFDACIIGNAACHGHTECDSIIMNHARIEAIPSLVANHIDAALMHEAAIGKIAGEQIIKLMTLGLTEQEAEEQIINGFLN